ncbi:hypothetical protein V4762_03865 [Thermodesulfobium sp. 4217-1]|uniref:hypothetical protein n=1 Tax=Thermodesulfobium sp. 4217-1 TaxID=3120013 RepID=UPI003221FA83
MIISKSNVNLQSVSSYEKSVVKNEKLQVFNNNSNGKLSTADILNDGLKKAFGDLSNSSANESSSSDNNTLSFTDSKEMLKILLLKAFIKSLTGKDVKIVPIDTSSDNNTSIQQAANQPNAAQSSGNNWGMIFTKNESLHEVESLNFSASGTLTTAAGQEIPINLNLNLGREFFQENSTSISAGDAKNVDPLVINFQNNTIAFSDKTYSFDLNSNGKPVQISFPTNGSGFLALDKNNNGVINNGSELFGPNTGNGFNELSAYDSDHNGFIDEGDPVYNKLTILTKDFSGSDQMHSLKDMNIGAISLQNTATIYNFKDSNNVSQAALKRTGFYVSNDFSAGSVMEVDLKI